MLDIKVDTGGRKTKTGNKTIQIEEVFTVCTREAKWVKLSGTLKRKEICVRSVKEGNKQLNL